VVDSGNAVAARPSEIPTARPSKTPAPGLGDPPPRRLGVLGGTFNPPHLAHLALARHALRELDLECALLIPARLAPHKSAAQDPGAAHRLEMCRLLTGPVEGVDVSPLELERDGPSYTVDTLRALHAAHPHTPVTFILGADVARTLPAWREPRELLALAELAIALRAGNAIRDVRADLASLPGDAGSGGRVRFLRMPTLDVSSSLVRERARRREPIEELVGPAVAAYIAAHDLYRMPLVAASPS
jgi:nicotinate-nucleotide adenylyltransferase